jgi:hypothetical protein
MKNIIIGACLMFLISSCATTAKFPISTVTPGADITAKMKIDKNKNYRICITANYLASVERLTPPKKTYVVWITTIRDGVKNLGQLVSKSSKKSTLETVTAFEPVDIFITAEDEGNISNPLGMEISRTFIKK